MQYNYSHGADTFKYENASKIIDFSSNINPLGIKEKWIQIDLKKLSEYPDNFATKLREKLATIHKLDKDNYIIGNGASDILFRYIYATKPKKVLLCAPSFSEYVKALNSINSSITYYNLKEEKDFVLDEEYLEILKQNDYDLIILTHPNNPNGSLIPKEIAKKLLEYTKKKQINTFIDECFIDLVYDKNKYSLKQYLNNNKQLFILDAFTKSYALAGLRIGYGISANIKLIQSLYLYGPDWPVNQIALQTALNALNEEYYLENSIDYLKKEYQKLKAALLELNYQVINTTTNFILIKGQNRQLKEDLLKYDILIRDCSNYQNLATGWYRIAIKDEQANNKLINTLKRIDNND
ncbi:pyridoxal phosphate-dependent aminotransferase [Mycoplasma sp. P36-A1]|uniref:pyridoxal phosphate-dependent aminotransferase n=1 Tax=Mycoplasma sp. P36-A1 TaxID=3252900 RepID=UPI003C2AEDA1